ncbi:pyridoxine 5'-phosphate synthase [Geminicoccus roseus]|uniref:pyridoxine 5'-phosphate synthase n=1 Tax=Geminicoccus roseus TaxID=404900 RepID=UPI0004057230|nr:pyridoxine 5'-phosphate synthase [Geminicoccus roseus]
MARRLRLGVNVDHVATVRNARGGAHPCPVRAAALVKKAGGDGITAHLREDRRHIRDQDVDRLKNEIALPLNLEMGVTDEMLAIALRVLPHAACLVPERREERTTEHGLAVAGQEERLLPFVARLKEAGIRVSLFVDADPRQLIAAAKVGADIVELHTGTYCDAGEAERPRELERIEAAAKLTVELGLECHAGHGLDYATVVPVAAIPAMVELNIGHFLVGEAIFRGFEGSLREMRRLMDEARGIPA